MARTDANESTSTVAIWMSLGAAAVFEVLTLPATQAMTVRSASPWKEDPYHTPVSLAQFAVPMLALTIALRLLAWRAPGGPDRARQTARAAWAMTALIGLTLAFEWTALIGTHAWFRRTWTTVLILGLIVTSVLTVAVTVSLVRNRQPSGFCGRWRHDWLGDVIVVCRSVPVVRRWVTPRAVVRVRRRAMNVFLGLSVLAAAVLTGCQAIGEHWTDPVLIAWMLVVETASNLALCIISNAVAGFIARPPRSPIRRIVEESTLAGCLAILVAIAFHDALWSALGSGSLTSRALVVLTLGPGLAASLITAALLAAHAHGSASA